MRTEDGSIIQACLNGEPGAFGVLVDKYREGIYAFVYTKLQDFHDAQDVTQEVFLQAYRGLRSLRRWESFAFWLYSIAYSRCGEWLRGRAKRADRDFIEDQDSKAIDAPSLDSYRKDQLVESVQEALSLLPEVHREVLILRYFGGMNSNEMARALGISPAAIRKRLSRARAQLREEMVDMMDTAFEGQKLPIGFTIRVVEAVKRIKINPMPRMAGLPWGLSLAVGIIVTVLSLNPHLSIPSDNVMPAGSPLNLQTERLKAGEIPIAILDVSQLPVSISKQEDKNHNTLAQSRHHLAPQREQGGRWTEKTGMPTARIYISASVVDGKIYVIGGRGNAPVELPTVEEYDPETDKWTQKADMHTERIDFPTVVLNGKIYAMGGVRNGNPLKDVEEYDPETDKWVQKADMLNARAEFPAVAVNGRIYAIGGWTPGGPLQTVEEYDPAKDTWRKRADIPTARDGAVAGAVNGKIYVAGGIGGGVALPTMEEYDPEANMWSRKPDMPSGCYFATAVTMNRKIYIMGGWRPDRAAVPGVFDNTGLAPDVDIYDPATGTWVEGVDMPAPRTTFAAGAVNGRIYAIGGARGICYTRMPCPGNSPPLSLVEEFTPGDWQTVSPQGKLTTTWGETKQR